MTWVVFVWVLLLLNDTARSMAWNFTRMNKHLYYYRGEHFPKLSYVIGVLTLFGDTFWGKLGLGRHGQAGRRQTFYLTLLVVCCFSGFSICCVLRQKVG